MWFSLERLGTYGRDVNDLSVDKAEAALRGLRYRTPAQGRLIACTISPCSSLTAPDYVAAKLDGPVAQLGYVSAFPVQTAPFGATTFQAQFSPSGYLSSVGYAQTTAPAVAATSAFSSAASAVAPVITALGPTQQLANQAAKLEALKKVRDDLAANNQDQAGAPYDAETALLKAQIAQLTSQQQEQAAAAAVRAATTP